MNPTIKEIGTATGWTYDDINITFPATAVAGDGLLLFISARKSSSGSIYDTPITGWTQIVYQDDRVHGNDGSAILVYHKIATASDISTGSVAFHLGSNVDDMNGICIAISNSPSSASILANSSLVNGEQTGVLGSVSPGANSVMFGFGASYRGVTTGSELQDVQLATDNVDFTELFKWYVPNYRNTCLWSATRTSANATGDVTFTFRTSSTDASIAFLALPAPLSPTVTTQAMSSIVSNTATANGNVTSSGDFTVTERGFCYKTSTGPTTSDSKVVVSGTTGSYSGSLIGLTNETTYYVRAYAINSIGTSYGEEVTFTSSGRPTVTTQAVTSIDLTAAVLNGNVTTDNGYLVTERGFCYKTSTGPTTSDSKVVVSGTTGSYSGSVSGLSVDTTYYVRAYAINAAGTAYGSEVTFDTLSANDKQLVKNIGAIDGESYSVSITVGGTTGTLTVKLGTTGYSQVVSAGAGVTVITGTYSGASGLILEISDGSDITVDNVYWTRYYSADNTIDWSLNQYTFLSPIDSSVTFRRIEDKELTRFDLYRYLDTEFKDLDGYVTVTITEEANDKSQNRSKTFIVGNETGTVSPFVKKRISMLSKNQAIIVGFSNNKLSEQFAICRYSLLGWKEPRKLYKVSKIISI